MTPEAVPVQHGQTKPGIYYTYPAYLQLCAREGDYVYVDQRPNMGSLVLTVHMYELIMLHIPRFLVRGFASAVLPLQFVNL